MRARAGRRPREQEGEEEADGRDAAWGLDSERMEGDTEEEEERV